MGNLRNYSTRQTRMQTEKNFFLELCLFPAVAPLSAYILLRW